MAGWPALSRRFLGRPSEADCEEIVVPLDGFSKTRRNIIIGTADGTAIAAVTLITKSG